MIDFIISLSTGFWLWGAFAAVGLFGFGAGWFFRGLQWPTDEELDQMDFKRIATKFTLSPKKEESK